MTNPAHCIKTLEKDRLHLDKSAYERGARFWLKVQLQRAPFFLVEVESADRSTTFWMTTSVDRAIELAKENWWRAGRVFAVIPSGQTLVCSAVQEVYGAEDSEARICRLESGLMLPGESGDLPNTLQRLYPS